MLERVTWFAAGGVSGAAGSVYARRKARVMAARYRPVGLAREAGARVRDRAAELAAALQEGRAAMREREAELRSALAAEGVTARPGPARRGPWRADGHERAGEVPARADDIGDARAVDQRVDDGDALAAHRPGRLGPRRRARRQGPRGATPGGSGSIDT